MSTGPCTWRVATTASPASTVPFAFVSLTKVACTVAPWWHRPVGLSEQRYIARGAPFQLSYRDAPGVQAEPAEGVRDAIVLGIVCTSGRYQGWEGHKGKIGNQGLRNSGRMANRIPENIAIGVGTDGARGRDITAQTGVSDIGHPKVLGVGGQLLEMRAMSSRAISTGKVRSRCCSIFKGVVEGCRKCCRQLHGCRTVCDMLRRPSQVRLIRDKEIDGPSALQLADNGRNIVNSIAGYRLWRGACRALCTASRRSLAPPHTMYNASTGARFTRVGSERVGSASVVR